MKNRKKILFVMNTMGRAGAEHALIQMMRSLDHEKYELFLYVLIPRGEVFAKVPDFVKILNRKTDCRSVLSLGGKFFIAGRLMKAAVSGGSLKNAVGHYAHSKEQLNQSGKKKELILRRMLADGTAALPYKFDLAVAYLEGPATWYVSEKVKAEKKAAFLHIDYVKAGYTRELDHGCYQRFDRIFAVSKDVREKFLSVYPEYKERVSLFFNIIDKEEIRRLAELPGGIKDGYGGIRLLTVGRLYYQKGYDNAVQTAAILKEMGYEFRWYVLGEGEEKKNIQNLIREKKLENDFILLGATDNPYPYFKQADIYVCTSRFEGKSIVIEEAQTLGKPVVSMRCTGIEEQISSGKDGVVTESDPSALAQEIGKLIDDPDRRKRFGIAAYKKDFFDRAGLEQFLSLIQE